MKEYSYGICPYIEKNNKTYILLIQPKGHKEWGFCKGKIEVNVITDYAQTDENGYNFDSPSSDGTPELTAEFNESFTSKFQEKINELDQYRSERMNASKELTKLNKQANLAISGGTTPSADLQKQISDLNNQISDLDSKSESLINSNPDLFTPYSETRNTYTNVYDTIIDGYEVINEYGDISYTLKDTTERLSIMKDKLMFQPAFFSGDKVDFRERLKFIQKCTKPASNGEGSGYAFTKAPVCHIRLGDWFNHDVIITSVIYNYENSPWTLDHRGQVQPMYVSITLSFNIVSEWHNQDKSREEVKMVPLADSDQGFFGGDPKSNI